MGRWEPDARGRLIRAAVDLFAERGYESTTVAQIAERAGLTRATFFRHFADKREVLFIGQAALVEAASTAIAGADAGATPLDAVGAGVAAMAALHTPDQRDYAPTLLAVVAAHDELRERAAFKRATIAAAMSAALRGRGVDPVAADLAADLGARAYYDGFDRWCAPSETRDLMPLCAAALAELRTAVAALS